MHLPTRAHFCRVYCFHIHFSERGKLIHLWNRASCTTQCMHQQVQFLDFGFQKNKNINKTLVPTGPCRSANTGGFIPFTKRTEKMCHSVLEGFNKLPAVLTQLLNMLNMLGGKKTDIAAVLGNYCIWSPNPCNNMTEQELKWVITSVF